MQRTKIKILMSAIFIFALVFVSSKVMYAQDTANQPQEALPFKDAIPLEEAENPDGIDEVDGETLNQEAEQEEPQVINAQPAEEVGDEVESDEAEEEFAEEDLQGAEGNLEDPEEIQEEPAGPVVVDMNQIITLDLRGMDVNDAMSYISLRSGANIVTSKAVTGRVTMQLKEVPLQDVFDITLLTNSLAYEKIGDIFYIMTEKEYEARYGKQFSDIREVKMVQLQYAIPEKAFDLLDTLKSTIGRILVDQESGAVLIVDTKAKIEEMTAALATLEQKSDMNIFNLQYAVAQDVEDQLRTQLDDINVGSIWSDVRNNQVIVQAFPDRMNDVENIIAALDQKTREVLIDTKIIKIQISDSLTSGFEWEGLFSSLFAGDDRAFVGSHPIQPVERLNLGFIDDFGTIQPEDDNPTAGSKVPFGQELFFGTTDPNHSFEVVMKFLATLGETRLLSNPKIAVINNQEARIHVGRQEAYITSTTTSGQTTTTTAEDVTFVDVGIQLSVTPTINQEGFVTMKIKPEVSSVVDTLVTPSGNQIPIIDTSTAETTVMVKDSSTIVIGGLRREEETAAAKRIPFVGDLPFLGTLFRSQTKGTERSELLVMITPHIVEGTLVTSGDIDDPGREATKSFKDYQTFDSLSDVYGPEFGDLEYKSFRD